MKRILQKFGMNFKKHFIEKQVHVKYKAGSKSKFPIPLMHEKHSTMRLVCAVIFYLTVLGLTVLLSC